MSTQELEPPKSDVSETSRLVDEPSTVTTAPGFYGPTISISHSALIFCSIIIANLTCIGLICVCLSGFSRFSNLPPWHKRSFNTLFLLLSTSLAFGIGFLMDRIGLVIRGTLLQKGAYSKEDVCNRSIIMFKVLIHCLIFVNLTALLWMFRSVIF